MRTDVVKVDKKKALEWLATTQGNRNLRSGKVQEYAADMPDRWALNGETIKFSPEGVLLDGHHRLHAVVEADCTVEFLVAYDVSPSAYDTIDTGCKRTYGDFAARSGEKRARLLGGALQELWAWKRFGHFGGSVYVRPSIRQLDELLSEHAGVRRSIDIGVPTKRILSPSVAIAMHYACSLKDRDLADIFFDQLATGDRLPSTSAVFLLRERLFRDRLAKARLPKVEVKALVAKAWNAERTGRQLKVLKWAAGSEDRPEPFPVLV